MTLQARHQAFLAIAAALIVASASPGAIYMRPDIEEVPVARLVANLEKELATDSKNPDIHLRLARLYAVAYAANTSELPVTVLAGADRKPRQERRPFPGSRRPGIPMPRGASPGTIRAGRRRRGKRS